jgi:hypothetical protein
MKGGNKMNTKNEIETIKKQICDLVDYVKVEKKRTDRIVQVLLHNLSEEQLNSRVKFLGEDCHKRFKRWGTFDGKTLQDFLLEIIDP